MHLLCKVKRSYDSHVFFMQGNPSGKVSSAVVKAMPGRDDLDSPWRQLATSSSPSISTLNPVFNLFTLTKLTEFCINYGYQRFVFNLKLSYNNIYVLVNSFECNPVAEGVLCAFKIRYRYHPRSKKNLGRHAGSW